MSSRKKKNKKGGGSTRPRLTARTADKFRLYEESVQDPEFDVRLLDRIFRKERGRHPLSVREDFCGTAWFAAEWVKSRPDRTAIGLDLDAPTLEYARKHHLEPLGEAAARVKLLKRDVMRGISAKVDMIVAFNFSYCIFQERNRLLRYFRKVREGLKREGVFVLDLHGGPDAQNPALEKRRKKGFTYVWDQRPMDAVSGTAIRYIHFRFPDGTEKKRAFRYDWRIWSLTELKDALRDAGFARVDVHWEGSDENGKGNGIFRKVRRAENEECYIAYLAAWVRDP